MGNLHRAVIIFYYGQDGYRIRAARDAAIRQFQAKHPERVSLTRCDCSENGAKELLEGACKTTSFFDDLHLVVLAYPFHSATTAAWVADVLAASGAATARDLVVLATADGTKAALTKLHRELAALLLSGSPVKEFKPLAASELPAWIIAACADRGGSIAPQAVAALAALGVSTEQLAQELDKLCAYAPERTITAADVALLVPMAREEANAFALTDALATGDRPRAAALLYQQLATGGDPYRVLALIAWQLRTLLTVQDLRSRGVTPSAIAQTSGLKPFVVTKALRAAPHSSLRAAYRDLCALDVSAKSGVGDLAGDLFSFLLASQAA